MKPFIFQFKEVPPEKTLDFSLVEYNQELNLNVNRKTQEPAVDILEMETETFTKAGHEVSDSDNNAINNLMDTHTATGEYREVTDTDQSDIHSLLDTETITLVSVEETDSDNDRVALQLVLDTSTLTESKEATDQDKDWK